MSLKAFHVVFILVSLLTALGFGFWCLREARITSESGTLVMGVGSFVVAAVLLVYGIWFLRKLKRVSYL